MRKDYISIFKPKIARHLLKLGNPIYDIKADKKEPMRTIFIFRNTEKLIKDFSTLKK